MWSHIKSKAHQKRCPEDKIRFARWLADSSPRGSPDEESEAAAEDKAADAALDPEDAATSNEAESELEDEDDAEEDEDEEDIVAPPAGLVALVAAAEAAEQSENALDAIEPAQEKNSTPETHEEVAAAPDATESGLEKESTPVQEVVLPPLDATELAQEKESTPDTQEGVISPAPADVRAPGEDSPPALAQRTLVKLTRETKTKKIQEFIDTVLAENPEFIKLRTTRHSQHSGWYLEWKTLMEMFETWLEAEHIQAWSFSKQLDKSLTSNKSHKVECDRLTDKPSQRLLKKKL